MAYKVLFTESAATDRDAVAEYLIGQLESRQTLIHFAEQLDSIIERLEQFPFSYPECSESRLRAKGYRKASFTEMSYLVLFSMQDEHTVVVTRIFHSRQDYAKLL